MAAKRKAKQLSEAVQKDVNIVRTAEGRYQIVDANNGRPLGSMAQGTFPTSSEALRIAEDRMKLRVRRIDKDINMKKQPRRKAVEDEEVDRDLSNEGNPAELESGGDAGDQVIKEEWEPLSSAVEAGKAFGNLKAIKDYFGDGGEGDLAKMDHPGMSEGLKALCDDGGPLDAAMSHIKNLVHEHHSKYAGDLDADAMMEKLCKSVEHVDGSGPAPYDEPTGLVEESVEQLEDDAPSNEIKDDSFEQGEANLVDSGVVPESDLEPLDEKQHGSDQDTEEIRERYQHPKTLQWSTRVVGKAWRAKNGRVYIKIAKQSSTCPECGARFVGDHCSGCGYTKPESKDLTDPGNPSELDPPTDTGAIIKDDEAGVKPEHVDAIGKAADHLDAAAEHAETPPMHKAAHQYHAKALREVHRDLSNMGNPEELKDDMPAGASDEGDLTAGVEELKDLDADEEEKAARPAKGKQPSPNVARALAELRQGDDELRRFVRLNGIKVN